jgi:quercetin 2,3-dioxygenase
VGGAGAGGVDELPLEVREDARLPVLGGEPPGERGEMWWNFVAQDRDEITAAWRDWDGRTGRFGDLHTLLSRIEAPRPPRVLAPA